MPHQNSRRSLRCTIVEDDPFMAGVAAAAECAADEVLAEDFALRELGEQPSREHRAGR